MIPNFVKICPSTQAMVHNLVNGCRALRQGFTTLWKASEHSGERSQLCEWLPSSQARIHKLVNGRPSTQANFHKKMFVDANMFTIPHFWENLPEHSGDLSCTQECLSEHSGEDSCPQESLPSTQAKIPVYRNVCPSTQARIPARRTCRPSTQAENIAWKNNSICFILVRITLLWCIESVF